MTSNGSAISSRLARATRRLVWAAVLALSSACAHHGGAARAETSSPGEKSVEMAAVQRQLTTFEELDIDGRLAILKRISQIGPDAAFVIPVLRVALRNSGGSVDDDYLAAIFRAARSMGSSGAPLAPAIIKAISFGAPQLAERDRYESTRLRAFGMAALVDMGCSDQCVPLALDVVINVDDHSSATEVGAAVRVLAGCESAGPALGPVLVSLLHLENATEEFSLASYEPRFAAAQATTIQLETLAALGRIGALKNARVCAMVRQLANSSATRREDLRAVALAQRLLDDEFRKTPLAGAKR